MRTIRLAILFSGNGSNLENIYKKMQGMVIDSTLCNSPLELHSADSANFECSQTPSLVSHSKFAENHESQTENPSVVFNDDTLETSKQNKQSKGLRCCFGLFSRETSEIGLGRPSSEVLCENNSNEYPKPNCKQDEFATIKLDFVLAVSSKNSAFGIQRCANLGLKCEIVDYKQHKESFIPQIIALLEKNQINLVVLAGFMRILPPEFTAKFRAINIHPSILPLFKGAHAIKESFESDMKIAGVSVHFVSDELDSGALIMQDIIHKIEGESLENFESRIHNLEYEIYPKAIIKAIQMLGNSSLELHSADSANFGRSQTPSLVSRPKFAENYESQTENPSVVLNADSSDSLLRGKSMDSRKTIQTKSK